MVARFALFRLIHKTLELRLRIVELRKSVRHFHPVDKKLEPLGDSGAVRFVAQAGQRALGGRPVVHRQQVIGSEAGLQAVGSLGEPRRALTLAETARPDAVVVADEAALSGVLRCTCESTSGRVEMC